MTEYLNRRAPHRDGSYDERRTYTTGTGQVLSNVHHPDLCEGEACVIHSPSDHVMKGFPTHYREDRGLMERICPHGVGHPDPDALAFGVRMNGDRGEGVHGCDGCCHE